MINFPEIRRYIFYVYFNSISYLSQEYIDNTLYDNNISISHKNRYKFNTL